jgi:hypothetical protein
MIQASWQLAAESFRYVITLLNAVPPILTALCDSVHKGKRSDGGRVHTEYTSGFRCEMSTYRSARRYANHEGYYSVSGWPLGSWCAYQVASRCRIVFSLKLSSGIGAITLS